MNPHVAPMSDAGRQVEEDSVAAAGRSASRRICAGTVAAALLGLFVQRMEAQTQTLLLPSGVAYDAAGDLFFVDTNRNQVFEVSLAGVLTTVAGTGVQGFAGDGGAAASALLNAPQGIAVGPDGTVYVADAGNQRIRAIAKGQISTFAGSGIAGFSGDGGVATVAMLSGPSALAMDASGTLLVCDTNNQRLRRISAGVIATFAGSGVQGFAGDGAAATAAELDSPGGVTVASDGRIFIADSHNNRLRVVETDGTIETFTGTGVAGYGGDGGAAAAAQIFIPRGVSVDAAGDVIFADANNQRLRMVNAAGVISTIAGSGWQGVTADGNVAVAGALNTPRGVAVSSFGAPVFADSPNQLVREVAANGAIYTVAVLMAPRVSSVSITAAQAIVYGQGSAGIVVGGSVPVPQGVVTLLDGGVSLGSATLAGGAATFGLGSLGAGVHALSGAYAGDGLNPAAVSAVAPVSIAQAPSTTALQSPAQASYAGLPLLLTAAVAPVIAGAPTGQVAFLDGGTIVATATLTNGMASGTYLTPAQGSHVLTATYAGDGNFLGSSSAGIVATVAAMPDFSVTVPAPSQTVQGGLIASFPLTVSSQGGVFTGGVTFSVAGLQSGATASFAPPVVVPGAAGVSSSLNVQTVALTGLAVPWRWGGRGVGLGVLALPLLLLGSSRRRQRRALCRWPVVLSLLLIVTVGCGARTISSVAEGSQRYTLTITATSTNLAGTIVVHTTSVSLVVE